MGVKHDSQRKICPTCGVEFKGVNGEVTCKGCRNSADGYVNTVGKDNGAWSSIGNGGYQRKAHI